jgi:glutamate racemase
VPAIAFFDSGVGGLPYLAAARQLLPGRRFIYLADRAGFPYGTKTPQAVQGLAVRAVQALAARFRPQAIVVACNTATEVAIDAMRAALPDVPIVGTVPAIKPAAALSGVRRIAVVATRRAVEEPYLLRLAERWAADCQLTRLGDGALVDFVEQRLFSASPAERLAAVRPAVDQALAAGADVLVLGCTHFLHLTEDFLAAVPAGRQLRLVDSRQGVAQQLARVVARADAAAAHAGADDNTGPDLMFLTGPQAFEARYEDFARRFGLEPAGSLY